MISLRKILRPSAFLEANASNQRSSDIISSSVNLLQ